MTSKAFLVTIATILFSVIHQATFDRISERIVVRQK